MPRADTFRGVVLLLVCCAGAASNGVQPAKVKPGAAAKKELEKLQGVWYHVSREVNGKETAGEDKESLFVVRGNIVVLKTGDKVGQVGMLKIVDPTSKPKKLDLIITDGANEGMTVLGVYQVDGDVFKYCGAIKSRPTSLATKAADEDYVYCSTYKKLKRLAPSNK
jgi:uncharacterized protein (TIGR03067 family)